MGSTCCKRGPSERRQGRKNRPNELGISPSATGKGGRKIINQFDGIVLQPGPDGRLQFPQRVNQQAPFGTPGPYGQPYPNAPNMALPSSPYTYQSATYDRPPGSPNPGGFPVQGGSPMHGGSPGIFPPSPTSARSLVVGGGGVDPNEPVLGLLSLRVVSAEVRRPPEHPVRPGPMVHVVVELANTTFMTEKRSATNPTFNESFKIVVLQKEQNAELSLTVNDGNVVGRGTIKVAELAPAAEAGDAVPVEKVLTVYEKVPGLFRDSLEPRGTVRVSVALQGAPAIERGFFNALVRMFDTDNDGLVNRAELGALLQTLCRTASPQEIDALYAAAGMPPGAPMGPLELHAARGALAAGGNLIRYTECPVCGKPLPPGDSAQFCHVGLCFMEGGDQAVDAFLLRGLLVEQSTSRTWVQKLLGGAVLPPEYAEEAGGIPVVNRETGQTFMERVPPFVKIPLAALSSGALEHEAKAALVRLSAEVGRRFDGPNSAALIDDFVVHSAIDVGELEQPVAAYRTFGEFWARRLRPGARPVAPAAASPRAAVCPVDGRCIVFPSVMAATQLWIKGRRFTVAELLGITDPRQAAQFDQCSLAVFRMAPGDCHRVHAPVEASARVQLVDGALLPADALTVRAGIDALTANRRLRVDLVGSPLGTVSMVLVGSTFAGSIQIGIKPNMRVKKGQEIAYFGLGGSCVVVVFQRGQIGFAPDLVANSTRPVETLVKSCSLLGAK